MRIIRKIRRGVEVMLAKIVKRGKFITVTMVAALLGSMLAAFPAYAADSDFPLIDHGIYYIQNRDTGNVVDVTGESTSNGAKIMQWDWWNGNNQKWIAHYVGNKTYYFTNLNSGKVLESPGSNTVWGTQMDQWGYNGGSNQLWELVPWDGYYWLKNKRNGLYLDAYAGDDHNGVAVVQWGFSGGNNQLWKFVQIGTDF